MATVTRNPNLKPVLTGRGGFILFAPKSNLPSPSTSLPTEPTSQLDSTQITAASELLALQRDGATLPTPVEKPKLLTDEEIVWLDQLGAEIQARLAQHLDDAERDAAAERDRGVDQKLVQPADGSRHK